MKRILNYRDFNIFTLDKEVWDIPYHNHNFYEIILVQAGKGKHRLNDITFTYKKGDVFLLTPSDEHEFEILRKTRFIYIKFTLHFFQTNFYGFKAYTKQRMERLLKRNFLGESMIKDKDDQRHIFQLAHILLHSFSNAPQFKEELITQLFMPILTILAKNVTMQHDNKKSMSTSIEKISNILSYINVYAVDKEKMRIAAMAKEFAMSPTYISIYVKKNTGLSIQRHILNYKMKAAEKMLQQSRFNINEIAEKLGFIDASHFNKFFKKYKSISPTVFQKNK